MPVRKGMFDVSYSGSSESQWTQVSQIPGFPFMVRVVIGEEVEKKRIKRSKRKRRKRRKRRRRKKRKRRKRENCLSSMKKILMTVLSFFHSFALR